MATFIRTKLFLFLITLLSSFSAYSHQGGIKGNLTDSLSNEKIVGAVVYLTENNQITSTDLLGNFYFPDIHPGTYKIKFSAIGFEAKTLNVEVKEQQTIQISALLNPAAINLSEVIVAQKGETGTSMQTLAKIDIDLSPTRSSQDILRMIPGLVTAQHAGGGKAEQIYLRGFDIDHGTDIRLTVDGMPVNMVSHAHGQGYADLHFLTPEAIDYVDFNKGPYYAQQGDFTTAGYANFNTKNSLDQSSIKMEGGMFDSYRTVGMFDLLGKELKAKNQSAYISSEYMSTNGYFESPQNFNRINLMGKYHGLISENKLLTISLSTFSSKWEASGQVPERAIEQNIITRFGAIDNKEGGNTSRTNANFILTSIADNGGVFKNQLFFSNYNFELYSNFTFFLEDSINGDQIRQKEKRNIYGYNGSYYKYSKLGNKRLRSEAGLQLRYDAVKDIELSHTAQRKITLNRLAFGQVNEVNAGLYVDETISLTDRFVVNAGARFDQFQFEYVNDLDTLYERKIKTSNIVSPKLNLYYTFNQNVQFYIKTGTGFHSNDTRVVVADSVANTLPRAVGADLGMFFKPVKRLLVNAAVWGLDLEQEFVYVGDAAVVEPSGKTRRYGFDLSFRYQLVDWLYLDMDANYTVPRSTEDPEGENFIPLAPTLTSIGGLTTKFKNGLSAGLRYRYVGDRPANEDNSVVAKGYMLYDAVINFTKAKYALGLSMENLANVNWNEAQFDTESKLKNENTSVSELHFTPGTPFFVKGSLTFFF
ncbi:MAG: TonB-dependent receptor [Bacteroidetes bacterium]|nr:TonB-dependent receptor [Bacteroidota bacterium]